MTDGERWAREALAELRADRLRPRALTRFLAASWRRAGERRGARPELARQAHGWSALGALPWVVRAAVGPERTRRRARAGLAWWGLTTLMLDWHLGMFETEAGEPRPLGAADACTLARAWLVPVAADRLSPHVCAAALVSDGLDGALARRCGPTRAGRDLEGLVDAAFTAAALRGAVRGRGLGRPAAGLEAGRLLAGAGLTCFAYFGRAQAPDRRVALAARSTTPIRAGGLLAASLGRRRAAGALVSAGALAGAAATLEQARRQRERPRGRRPGRSATRLPAEPLRG